MRRVCLGLSLLAMAFAGCADGATQGGAALPAGQCVGPAASDQAANQTAGAFALEDFQPKSCGYGQVYGLERFVGKATLVSLLAGW